MSIDLEERLTRLASTWDHEAPTITAEEVMARGEPTLPIAHDFPDEGEIAVVRAFADEPPRRRLRAMAIYGGAAAAIVVGVAVVIAIRSDETPPQQSPVTTDVPQTTFGVPTSTVTVPSTPAVDIATTDATTEVTTTETGNVEPATEAPTTISSSAQAADRVADIRLQATDALAALNGFRGVVTNHTTQTAADGSMASDNTLTNTVTLMGDGRMWSEGDSFLWTSFDPATGIVRGHYRMPDGTDGYQEIDGWADNSTGINIIFGNDPVPNFAAMTSPTSVEDVVQDGRAAWKITTTTELFGVSPGGPPGSGTAPSTSETESTQMDSFTIDQQTGLLIGHSTSSPQPEGARYMQESTISLLELNPSLPEQFPGEFPPGAVVDRSGDPAAFQLLDPATAALQFGHEVYLPADLPPTARLSLQTIQSGQDEDWKMLTIELPKGFTKARIVLAVPNLSGGPTNGSVPLETLSSGALAGLPYQIDSAGQVGVIGAPVGVTVSAATPDAALALANSLVLR